MEEYLYTKGLWSKWIYTDASPSIHVVSLPIPASLTTSMHICALDYHYKVFVTLEPLILVKSVENTAPAMLLEVSTGGGGGGRFFPKSLLRGVTISATRVRGKLRYGHVQNVSRVSESKPPVFPKKHKKTKI